MLDSASVDRARLAHLAKVLQKDDDLVWACLFGSAAKGERCRDVDVAVMPREAAYRDAVEFGALRVRLEEAVGTELDLVDLRSASLPLMGEILGVRHVLLDRDPHARHKWEAEQAVRWLDFQPTYERASAIRLKALRQRLGTP